eukprot:11091407-Lingulodinium_polyedra.AAC.1
MKKREQKNQKKPQTASGHPRLTDPAASGHPRLTDLAGSRAAQPRVEATAAAGRQLRAIPV